MTLNELFDGDWKYLWFYDPAAHNAALEESVSDVTSHLDAAVCAVENFEENASSDIAAVIKLEAKKRSLKSASVMKTIRIAVTGEKVGHCFFVFHFLPYLRFCSRYRRDPRWPNCTPC